MACVQRTPHGRHGLTLVELLMVISIMALLMVVAVPMIRPAFQDRYVREAARVLESYLFGAQARAAETGRPVGVWIERVGDTDMGSRSAVRLYMAETAPNFTGTLLDSRVRVAASGLIGTLQFADINDLAVLRTITSLNDRFTIKFDHKGHDYRGQRTAADTFEIEMPLGAPPGAGASGPGVSYEITLPPARSAVGSVQLPADSVIDLSLSGTGMTGRQLDPAAVAPLITSPVVIMFAPGGRVDRVYLGGQPEQVFAPIHLFVGRRARVLNPATASAADLSNPARANLADTTCMWVTISDRTGTVVTTDNADTSYLTTPTLTDRLRAARQLARASAQKGGR